MKSVYVAALLAASAYAASHIGPDVDAEIGGNQTAGTTTTDVPDVDVETTSMPAVRKAQIQTVEGDMTISSKNTISFNQGGTIVSVNDILQRISDLEAALQQKVADLESGLVDARDEIDAAKTGLGNQLTAVQTAMTTANNDLSGKIDDVKTDLNDVKTDMNDYFVNIAKSVACTKSGGAIQAIDATGSSSCTTKISSVAEISSRITSQTTSFLAGYNFYKNKQIRIAMDQITYPTYTKYISVMDMMVDSDENSRNLHFDQSYYCARQKDNGPEAFMVWNLPQGTAMTKFILWDRTTNSKESSDIYWSSDYSKMKTSANFRTNYVKIANNAQFNKVFSFSTKVQPVNLLHSQYVADIYTDTSGNTDCFSGATVTFKRVSFPGM